MNEPLRLIQHLYDEEADPDALERRMAEDAALRREYDALRETKKAMDGQPSHRPDPAVVDRIVAAAGTAARKSEAQESGAPRSRSLRTDRPPQSRTDRTRDSAAWTRRLRTAGAALAVLLVAGVGWWQFAPSSSSPAVPSADVQALQDALNEAEPARRLDGATPVQQAASVPEWDEGDDVVRLHRRLEVLQARSPSGQWSGLQPARTSERP